MKIIWMETDVAEAYGTGNPEDFRLQKMVDLIMAKGMSGKIFFHSDFGKVESGSVVKFRDRLDFPKTFAEYIKTRKDPKMRVSVLRCRNGKIQFIGCWDKGIKIY